MPFHIVLVSHWRLCAVCNEKRWRVSLKVAELCDNLPFGLIIRGLQWQYASTLVLLPADMLCEGETSDCRYFLPVRHGQGSRECFKREAKMGFRKEAETFVKSRLITVLVLLLHSVCHFYLVRLLIASRMGIPSFRRCEWIVF